MRCRFDSRVDFLGIKWSSRPTSDYPRCPPIKSPVISSRSNSARIPPSYPSEHWTFVWPLYNVGPTSKTLGRRCTNVIQMFCDPVPANTKHLYNICAMLDQRWRRWAGVVQNVIEMFCVCWDVTSMAAHWWVSLVSVRVKEGSVRVKEGRSRPIWKETSTLLRGIGRFNVRSASNTFTQRWIYVEPLSRSGRSSYYRQNLHLQLHNLC